MSYGNALSDLTFDEEFYAVDDHNNSGFDVLEHQYVEEQDSYDEFGVG